MGYIYNFPFELCRSKQKPPFRVKICSDICPRTLFVPRISQFSESVQIMSKDDPSIFFKSNGNWFVCYPSNIILFAVCELRNTTQIFPSFS